MSAIDFPDNLDRGARYHVHYWLKALSSEHDVDFLLVESYSQGRVDVPQLTSAKVINLSEPPRTALHSRAMRVARSVISGIPSSAQIAMPQAAVQYVRQATPRSSKGPFPSFLAAYPWTPWTLATSGSATACGIPGGPLMSGSYVATKPEPAVPRPPYPR